MKRTCLALGLAMLLVACGGGGASDAATGGDPTGGPARGATDGGSDTPHQTQPDGGAVSTVVDGGSNDSGTHDAGGDAGAPQTDGGSIARGTAIWSVDAPVGDDSRLAASATHVAVVSQPGDVTMLTSAGQGKVTIASEAWYLRTIGGVIVATGWERVGGGSVSGIFTADVTAAGLSNKTVAKVAQEKLVGNIMGDAQRNIGVAYAPSQEGTTIFSRMSPTGTQLAQSTFTEPNLNAAFTIVNAAMGADGSLASMGSVAPVIHGLVPGKAPFTYTMPGGGGSGGLDFGTDRLAIASNDGTRAFVHTVSSTGTLLEAARLDGMRIYAVLLVSPHEVIVAGATDGVVSSERGTVKRYDLTSGTEVWAYHLPEVANAVQCGRALALSPDGALYAAFNGAGAGTIVRLTP